MQLTLTKLLAGLVVQNSYGSQKQNGTLTLILKHLTVKILKFVITWKLILLLFKKMTFQAIQRISCWNKMKRVLAFVKKFLSILKQTAKTKQLTKNTSKQNSLSLKVQNINDSEETIIKLYQRRYFKEEIDLLEKIKNRSQNSLPHSSEINTLETFLGDKKILCVGDRLKRSNLNLDYVHPILLFCEGIVTNSVIKWYH